MDLLEASETNKFERRGDVSLLLLELVSLEPLILSCDKRSQRPAAAGLRAVATDLVVSAVRQVRALRVTRVTAAAPHAPTGGTAGGRFPARVPPVAAPAGGNPMPHRERSPLRRSPKPVEEKKGAAPQPLEKDEEKEQDSSESDEEEEESEAASDKTILVDPLLPPATVAPGTSGKAKPPAPPKGVAERIKTEEKADYGEEEQAGGSTVPEESGRRRRHRHRPSQPSRPERKDDKSYRKRKHRNPKHRAGRKHKRLYRAERDPYLKIHRKLDESEAEVELVGAGGAYGLFDVNEPARWSTMEIKLGDIITTAVPGELLGADGVEGIFLVTGIELGADGSALVRVKSVGSSHPEALAILSSFFNRKEGHLHVCASAGFCEEEGGVFHVHRLELWDGLTFPTHRLSPAGKRIVKQFEAGEELDEVREPLEGAAGRPSALRKKPSGEPKEAQLRGKGQGDRRDRPKDTRKSAKAKQPGPAGSAAGTLRARLDQVRKRQQSLGLGQGALTGGDHLGVEGDGDVDPVQEGLGTSTKLGPPKGAAGPRRAALTSGE
ncbi:unnamed protein product, partial [Durusdinium trenchii]